MGRTRAMRFGCVLLGVLAILPAHAQFLEGSLVRLDFEPATYALVSLTDKENAFSLSFYGEAPLWRLIVMDTSAAPPNVDWSADFDEVWATSVAGYRSSSLVDTGTVRTLHLDWTAFPLPNGGHATVNVEVTLPVDSFESQWQATVTTSGMGDALWRLDFPVFMLNPIGDTPENDIAAVPIHSGLLVRNPHVNSVAGGTGASELRDDMGLPGNHPGSWEMQWMQVYDEDSRQGLFLRSTDSVGYTKGLTMIPYLGRTLLLWRHYPAGNTSPNVTYTPPYDVRLRPLVGDWFDAARSYRSWLLAQPWCSRGPIRTRTDFPHDLGESLAISLFTELDTFSSASEVVASVQGWQDFFGEGIVASHLRGWGSGLPDAAIPQEFVDGVAELNARGIHSSPYTNTHGWPQGASDDGSGTRADGVAKTLNGAWFYSPEFSEWKMCVGSEAWRGKYVSITSALVDAGTTDQYCDLYPSSRLCFDPGHGHPGGGGRWWIDGYRSQIAAARAAARAVRPEFAMTPEHRSDTGIDLFDAYSVNYWSYGDDVFRGSVETGIPIPIIAATIHDYIGCLGGTQVPYSVIGSLHFRFAQGWGFVHGNVATIYEDKAPSIAPFSQDKLRDFEYLRELIRYRHAVPELLVYGEYLRPPDTGSGTQDVVMFGEAFAQPVILGSAFRAADGTLGVFMTNYNLAPHTADFTVNRSDYSLGTGTYEIYSVTPQGRLFYGGFRGSDYTRKWILEAGGILMLEILPASDTDADGMSDAWESTHSFNINSPADALDDEDQDSLSNLEEFQNGTDPYLADSDNDGFSDSEEVSYGSDPRTDESHSEPEVTVPAISLIMTLALLLALMALGTANHVVFAKTPSNRSLHDIPVGSDRGKSQESK